LGANPKRQFIAQFVGVFAGTAIVVPAFYVLVPSAADLGGDKWPAPAAMVWMKVAELLSEGPEKLHYTARMGLLCGALAGVIMPIIEMFLPKSMRRFWPSATGLGLSFVLPFWNALSFFIGALLARLWQMQNKESAEKFMIPVASGVIAGESLVGVGDALWAAVPGLLGELRKG
jgi:uncharacterized oligopeptide transporter (OPT) family protein